MDYTTDLAMDHYVKDLEPIPLSPQRKTEVENDITENERTQLRGLLGGVQFKAQQQGPEYSAGCGELQSTVTKAKVKTLIAGNKLLQKIAVGGRSSNAYAQDRRPYGRRLGRRITCYKA